MRLARDFGTVSTLFPEGIDSLYDLPHNVFDNIRSAMLVLAFDELPDDETPPRRIWDQPVKLKAHFEWIKRKRKAEANPDAAIADREIEDPVDNKYSLVVG